MDTHRAAVPTEAHPARPASPRDSGPRAYREPRPSPALIHALRWLNRGLVLPHLARLAEIDLPRADGGRLAATLGPGQAAFLAPNHPDFLGDWLLDKEIADRFSPLMAHWAAFDIVNAHPLARWFWGRNNVLSTGSGSAGLEHAARWALLGHGVLLHPEGTVAWHGARVGPLLPGIAGMAWEACRRSAAADGRARVWIVPLLYRHRFNGDATEGLTRELALIERRLAFPSGAGLVLEARFAVLLARTLERERAGLEDAEARRPIEAAGSGFFPEAQALGQALRARLERRYGTVEGEFPRVLHRLRRAIRLRAAEDPEGAHQDRDRLDAWAMWQSFTGADYDTPTLSQEQIAECLKRLRLTLVRGGPGDALHNVLPRPVARRVAHVRVAEPIAVDERFDPGADTNAAQGRLLTALGERMQRTLDALGAEIEPLVARWRRPNPLWTGGARRA
jgi:hypothetical protein